MATTASAPAPTKVIWVEPAAWDSVPNVNETRYVYNAAKRLRVPDLGYEVYLERFSTFTSSYLNQQLGDTLKSNVEEAVVCGNYVRALKESVRLCAEKDKELEREPAQDYDIPLAKRTLFVEPEERMVTVRINTGKGGRQEFSVLESAAKDMDGCD